MFKRIDHVEIVVPNLDRAIDFYVGVLGFSVRSRRAVSVGPVSEVAFLELKDTALELLTGPAVPASPERWQAGYRGMALEVADMGEALRYLKSKGIAPSVEPRTIGRSQRAEIRDPDGLSIELRQW